MTQDIEVLKKIKEKEEEARRRIEEARKKAEEIVSSAREDAERIIKEAEEKGTMLYQQYLREKAEETALEVSNVKKEYEGKIEKIKKNISEEVVEKMFEMLVR